MDTKNIQNASRIFIVDILESGAGLNSFITLLNTYYETKKCQKPDLRFMCVTHFVFPEFELKEKTNYSFTRVMKKKEECGQNNFTLTFVENKERNLKPHVIQTHLVPIRDYATFTLDAGAIQDTFSPGSSYPAINWHPKFDQLREKGAPLSTWAKGYLEKLFVDVIDNHMGIMEGMTASG